MAGMQFITLALIYLLQIGEVNGQVSCYECVDMPHPSDCEFATRCSASEKCFVEQIITSGGLVLYNSGCKAITRCMARGRRDVYSPSGLQKRDDVTVCQNCCDGEFCNDNGCGQLAQRFPQRGLKCYHCKDSIDLNDCRDLTICQDQSEVCSVHEFVGPDNKPRYQSKCERSFVCKALANLHNNNNMCVYCCDSDFCNNVCNGTSGGTGSSGGAITRIPGNTPPTSPRPTQTTMKVTTTPPTTTTMKISPQDGPRDFYVDGVYDPSGSSFKCQNNNACSFVQWGTGQPDNASSKQCLYLNGSDSMKWYNADCSERKRFICTKAI